jgi:TolA-binding protein
MKRLLLLSLSLGLNAVPLRAEWTHVLPPELYQTMNLGQRAAMDQALALFGRGGEGRNRNEQQIHRNAANEWERFRTQHGDTVDPEIFGYSLFMQAMSQRGAHERHTAIRTFTEVLDFFPEDTWIAAPALYFRAMTRFEMGEDRQGFADLVTMTDHEEYGRHPLAADALVRIADNHWSNRRSRQAVALWTRVEEDFQGQHRDAERTAQSRLLDWALVQGSLDEAWERRRARETRGPEARRDLNATRGLFTEGIRDLHGRYQSWYFHHIHSEAAGDTLRDRRRDLLYDWFIAKQSDFAAEGQLWDFLLARYDFHSRFRTEAMDELLTDTVAYLRADADDPARRQRRAGELIDRLTRLQRWDNAISLLEFYPDPADRLWRLFSINQRRNAFEENLSILDQITALEDPEQSRRAMRERATLYHRRLSRYEDAIRLYYEINDPPDTLWQIVDAHRRAGQRDAARNVLTEIASIFPDQAARAVFTQAEHHRSDGERDAAVTLYLRVLRHPEWTRTQEASRSHDRLEAMGLDTAGGVIHDVN